VTRQAGALRESVIELRNECATTPTMRVALPTVREWPFRGATVLDTTATVP